jgi:predicted SAM-dependent methyltransferase
MSSSVDKSAVTPKQRFGRWIARLLGLNWRTVRRLRFEAAAARARIGNAVSPRYYLRRRNLRGKRGLNVNIGSGGRGFDGWINLDLGGHEDILFPWDIRRGFPFADGQVARLFAEHVIEHIEFREDLPNVLASILRVLQPGGRVRIVVPDCERYLDAYLARDAAKWSALGLPKLPHDMPTHMAMVNHVFHQEGEHFFGYDFETLAYVLRSAGFAEVRRQAFEVSEDALLCLDRPEHAPYSLYVEAVKPGGAPPGRP